MRWVRDLTGRFAQRPHYETEELDGECEDLIYDHLRKRNGKVAFPIDTEDIVALLESRVAELDPYADLRGEGVDVEGATAFFRGSRPMVKISAALYAPNLVNRLRTTLTHELGHVHFHTCLYGLDVTDDLFETRQPTFNATCYRGSILGAPKTDWMEWQAGYACGSLLMPATDVKELVRGAHGRGGSSRPSVDSEFGAELIANTMHRYAVSQDAARVRLLVLGHLTP
jgi:hypothetical protein